MNIERFENLVCWQKAEELTVFIYEILKSNKDYGFKDQIFRASVSIMNNIAEGFERKGDNEFKHFLSISKGSCGETRSMAHLAVKLKYIDIDNYNKIISLTDEISKTIFGLMRAL